ncbi:rhomboid family intramembrane serine protease [Candidatus Eisenbacteria bacterium]|uniref:Rhomboid family intramembrane serine protease n=1 Tax=Eiseniibacteriota bacterium TaxID=2212470 RepID=A0ABV6YK82_UNCEI
MNGYGRGGIRLGVGFTEGVKYLLIWNGIFFLLQEFIVPGKNLVAGLRIEELLGIVPVLVLKRFFIWQLVTYMFLHGGFFHILFNMVILWMCGSELERLWGTRRLLTYYFFTGIGAGLMTVLFTPHGQFPTIGASGAIYGLLLAYAVYFPDRRIYLYFLIPIPVRLFVIVIAVITLLSSISQPGDGIAHVAHLGGFVFGWIYLRWVAGAFQRWMSRRRRRHLRVVSSDDERRYRR